MTDQDQPDDPLLLACRYLSRQMDLFDQAAAHALGIGRNDLRALNLLEHGPLSAATIADRLGLTRAGVTTLIDRLEQHELVARTPLPGDRRVVRIVLQQTTWSAFAKIYRPLGRHVQTVAAELEPHDRQKVTAALNTLTHAFAEARTHLAANADPVEWRGKRKLDQAASTRRDSVPSSMLSSRVTRANHRPTSR